MCDVHLTTGFYGNDVAVAKFAILYRNYNNTVVCEFC